MPCADGIFTERTTRFLELASEKINKLLSKYEEAVSVCKKTSELYEQYESKNCLPDNYFKRWSEFADDFELA